MVLCVNCLTSDANMDASKKMTRPVDAQGATPAANKLDPDAVALLGDANRPSSRTHQARAFHTWRCRLVSLREAVPAITC